MSNILEWLYNDEPIDSKHILTVVIPDVHINEDIVIDEVERSTYCPQCNMFTTGLPCSDENCVW